VDYWIWAFQIAGVGSLMTSIKFLVTILKMRAPGMSLMRMPIFVRTALATTILLILFGIFGAAVVQMLVHLHYFLHLDSSSGNVAALIFTVLIMVLFAGGSIWIMYSLYYPMM
jgi:heme/copper-type cytochrome/quinol oxidase subunit 1